jgi:hypothetical protein
MEHEHWSRMYKDFTALQLERAQEDVQSAEDQLKSAEEYMCSIIHAIGCLGFTVEFIDSHTAGVVKIQHSMFSNILYGNLLITYKKLIPSQYRVLLPYLCSLIE